jgi:glycosyltransferase involved in cell wall biosynthesis
MMKIIHVTTLHSSTDARIYYRECRSLAEVYDYEVHLAAPSAEELELKLKAISLPRPFKFRPLRIAQSNFTLLKLLIRHRADVWHLHDPELLPVSIMASFFVKDKFIWDAHENYLEQLAAKYSKRNQNYTLRLFLSKIVKLCFTLADKRFTGIVAATPSIGKFYKNPNTVSVSNFVDHEFFKDAISSPSNTYLLFTGAPNDSALLHAIISAGRTIDFELVISGEKPDPQLFFLGKQIFGDKINFLGFQSHDKLRKLISGARFGFVTYDDSQHEEDAFPTKLGEFLACGLPVISTPNSFLQRYQLDNFGIVTEGFDSEAIASGIREAIEIDNFKWNNFSKAGKDWVLKNNWKSNGKVELLDFYSKIVKL